MDLEGVFLDGRWILPGSTVRSCHHLFQPKRGLEFPNIAGLALSLDFHIIQCVAVNRRDFERPPAENTFTLDALGWNYRARGR
jgi:hypothetical protein